MESTLTIRRGTEKAKTATAYKFKIQHLAGQTHLQYMASIARDESQVAKELQQSGPERDAKIHPPRYSGLILDQPSILLTSRPCKRLPSIIWANNVAILPNIPQR